MSKMKITFNRPYLTGKESHYLYQAVFAGHLSGNGRFTKQCHAFFEGRYGFPKCLLTTSCTDALEMCALLADIQPGDEVIMPSFTFVSTANAFVLRGAKIVFVDSKPNHPNLDEALLEALITPRTKAIVVMHYAGIACDMDPILNLAKQHKLIVVEDAAQAIESYYSGRILGSLGNLSTFSFHETKNIHAGEGGMLAINDTSFLGRAEILWEKGTNRAAFFRGETDKYNWVDVGSSYLPSEMVAAFLFAQLEHIEDIQAQRLRLWQKYWEGLFPFADGGFFQLPFIPSYATNNGHMFYLVCRSGEERSGLLTHLKKSGVHAVFHYQSLHASPFYREKHDGRSLPWSDHYSDCLVRLPMFYELTAEQQAWIIECIWAFYAKK